jgi:hypothetical protein
MYSVKRHNQTGKRDKDKKRDIKQHRRKTRKDFDPFGKQIKQYGKNQKRKPKQFDFLYQKNIYDLIDIPQVEKHQAQKVKGINEKKNITNGFAHDMRHGIAEVYTRNISEKQRVNKIN